MNALTVACLVVASAAFGQEPLLVHEFKWAGQDSHVVLSGTLVGEELKLQNSSDIPMTVRLVTIGSPAIGYPQYAFVGKLRYENVEGKGYVEMWNYFPDGGRYFSRTLGDSGPMGALTGTSPGRALIVPFFNKVDGPAPTRLELNVVLPGRGTVIVGPLRLMQYKSPGDVGLMSHDLSGRHAWWNGWQAGVLGGSLGAIMGILGSYVYRLASRGRSRSLVVGLVAGVTVFGAVLVVLGWAARRLAQPPEVYLMLLLLGSGGLLYGLNLPNYLRLLRQAEARRMQAQDA